MRPLSFDHASAVELLRDQLDVFVAAARSFSDYDLLAASRVHGWSRSEVVVHSRLGLEEMVGVCAAQVDDEPDHDAASYWASFAADDDDRVPHIMWMRRTVEAVADVDLPDAWTDADAALFSLGRVPLPDGAAELVDVLPLSI